MRQFITVFAMVLLPVLGTCGDSTSPSSSSVEGRYVLQTVNGKSLPAAVVADSSLGSIYRVDITGGTLALQSGAGFVAVTASRTTDGSTVSTANTTESGTYSVVGTSITLRTSADSLSGTTSANTVTLNNSDGSFVYTK